MIRQRDFSASSTLLPFAAQAQAAHRSEMPLACENIFEPLVPRPAAPEVVDRLAQRSRQYLDPF